MAAQSLEAPGPPRKRQSARQTAWSPDLGCLAAQGAARSPPPLSRWSLGQEGGTGLLLQPRPAPRPGTCARCRPRRHMRPRAAAACPEPASRRRPRPGARPGARAGGSLVPAGRREQHSSFSQMLRSRAANALQKTWKTAPRPCDPVIDATRETCSLALLSAAF